MAKSATAKVTPSVLIWARETRGIDLRSASKKIGVDLAELQAWEAGEESPSFAKLKLLATVYKRPTATFFLVNPPTEPAPPKDFRLVSEGTTKGLSPDALLEIRRARRRQAQALELMQLMGREPVEFKLKADLNSAEPERLATEYRNRFGITVEQQSKFSSEYDSLYYWRSAVERLGVLVFQASLDLSEDFRGLSIAEKYFPIILLNTKDPPQARAFSLLHEFCHLLLNNSGFCNMEMPANRRTAYNPIEVFCNAFAGAALVPKEFLQAEQVLRGIPADGEVPDTVLRTLAKKYRVSWEVILRRLLELNLTDQSFYQKKRKQINEWLAIQKKGQTPIVLPDTMAVVENGVSFTKLAFDGHHSKLITTTELARFLGVKVRWLDSIEQNVSGRSET